MTAKRTPKDDALTLPLTAAQSRKIVTYNNQVQAATAVLNEYFSGVLDAAKVDGAWTVTNVDTDKLELKLEPLKG